MRIIKQPDSFDTFKINETEKAKAFISKDVELLKSIGCKVKIICKDIDYKILSVDRSSHSYNSFFIALLDKLLKKLTNQKAIQIETIGKICVIELTVSSNDSENKSKNKKTIRYFVFKYNKKNDKYVIKFCNNILYHLFIKNLIRKVKKNKEKAFAKTSGYSVFKTFFPLRTEETEPTLFACLFVIIATLVLSIIIELIVMISQK